MSLVSGNNSSHSDDLEYWEFVHCAVCFLPFAPDPTNPAVPPSIPFWLTECGHTVCNNHLNADQSCAPCGAPSIQLVPLQREMLPPMSGWFRSVPIELDNIAHAAKFQQENMASLIRFYRRKCTQQHAMISKTKAALADTKALRSQIEHLQRENEQLRAAAGMPEAPHSDQRYAYGTNRHAAAEAQEPGPSRNANGKRPLANNNQNQRTSSPRSIVTPVAPPRLILPPDHQQPVFPSGINNSNSGGVGMQQAEDSNMRPGSSRFAHYAFQPPETPLRAQPLRHQQQPQSHRRPQQQNELQENHHQGHHRQQQQHQQPQQRQQQHQQQHQPQHQRMLPPPMPGRAPSTTTISQHQTTARGPFRPAAQAPMQRGRGPQLQMLPPPAPAPTRPLQPFPMTIPDTDRVSSAQPSSSRLIPMSSSSAQFRAAPQTPSNRFFPGSGSGVVSSRAQTFPPGTAGGGSTRAQFVPERG